MPIPTYAVVGDADGNPTDAACTHLIEIAQVSPSTTQGCEDCLREGTRWVHLRECLQCGHVGCCDNSPRRHATAHFHATAHPIMRSLEPAEDWAWCYIDSLFLEPV
jgi:uncharacterized UBP type Zn finger protein